MQKRHTSHLPALMHLPFSWRKQMRTRGNLALVEANEDSTEVKPGTPRPLLMNFMEKLPGSVVKSPTMSDDHTYMGSTGGSEDMDYQSD